MAPLPMPIKLSINDARQKGPVIKNEKNPNIPIPRSASIRQMKPAFTAPVFDFSLIDVAA